MRTPLTIATGLLLVAGVVVGVTSAAQAADSALPPVEPIRVEAPAQPAPVADAAPIDAAPAPTPAPTPALPAEPQRDADGNVAPPPADDDDDDDLDDDLDDDGLDDDGADDD